MLPEDISASKEAKDIIFDCCTGEQAHISVYTQLSSAVLTDEHSRPVQSG